eukprot:Colp12_sorted_trinity150504_noHs@16523
MLITVPDSRKGKKGTEEFIEYNIFVNGRYCCSHRYSEFNTLRDELKVEVPQFVFNGFPRKWPFSLSQEQEEDRRKGLEAFMQAVSLDNTASKSEKFKAFLTPTLEALPDDAAQRIVEIGVLLPDNTVLQLTAKAADFASVYYEDAVRKLGISPMGANFFTLFEITETGYERKLGSDEQPFRIFRRWKKSSGGAKCPLSLKRWLFTSPQEALAASDPKATALLFAEAVSRVSRGDVVANEAQARRLAELAAADEKIQYLTEARKLEGYGVLQFPSCAAAVGSANYTANVCIALDSFSLVSPGSKMPQVVVRWREVRRWRVEPDGFLLEYSGEGEQALKVITDYAQFMSDACLRVVTEIQWSKDVRQRNKVNRQSSVASQASVTSVASSASTDTAASERSRDSRASDRISVIGSRAKNHPNLQRQITVKNFFDASALESSSHISDSDL